VDILCGMWIFSVGCGYSLWDVDILCGMWILSVGCGYSLWDVDILCGMWIFSVGCGYSLQVPREFCESFMAKDVAVVVAAVLPSRSVSSCTIRTEQPAVMIFRIYIEIILRKVLTPCLSH